MGKKKGISSLPPVTAATCMALLAAKHTKDLFVPECKDGPTWSTNHFRMDAWVLRRSWAHPCVTGYEVKVHRSDFTGDEKWPAYLACCNEFYFVCPAGLIQEDELPKEVGLLWVSPSGGKLYAKRRAVYRPVAIPDEVYRYVLISRVEVRVNRWSGINEPTTSSEYWLKWLKEEQNEYILGRSVSRKMRKLVEERVDAVEVKQKRLEEQMRHYDDVRRVLKALGMSADYVYSYDVERRLRRLREAVPEDVRHAITSLKSGIRDFEAVLEGLETEEKKPREVDPQEATP